MFPRTFRAMSSVVSFWVAVGFATLLLGDSVLRGAWPTLIAFLAPVLLVLWAVWLLLWRTSVRALPDRVIVTNLLRVHEVPWSRVSGVRQSGQIILELDDSRRLTCWGGPFPPRPGIPRPHRQRVETTHSPVSFAQTLEAFRDSAPRSAEPRRTRWDLVALIPGVVLAVVTLARFFVPAG